MSKKIPTIWPIDPHTKAKIEILSYYLQAWFPILGRNSENPVLYIDGFSGPGRYKGSEDGSPVAALKTLNQSIADNAGKLKTSGVFCEFIEADPKRFEELKATVEEMEVSPRITSNVQRTDFVTGITSLKTKYRNHFHGGNPIFVFADPFGGTDTPMEAFDGWMKTDRSELLLNLDADGIARIYAGKNNNWEEQLTATFGGRCWETELGDDSLNLGQKAAKILHLYKRRLKEVLGVEYVFEFEMRGKFDKINYYLVFATNHPRGMVKMKEAMSRVDQNGRYCFSDADEHQQFLFGDDGLEIYAEKLRNEYLEKTVSFHDIEKYCLCETPAKSASSLLNILERKNQIEVHPEIGVTRKRGSFKKESIKSIRFQRALEQPTLF